LTYVSEVSQKKKYHILTHICGIKKKMIQMNLLAKQKRDTDIEIKRMDTKTGKGKWDELGDWDSMHTLLRME